MRLKKGNLIKGSNTHSAWYSRLVKRHQYSQSAILLHFQRECKKVDQIGDKEIFIENYSALIKSAQDQNISAWIL